MWYFLSVYFVQVESLEKVRSGCLFWGQLDAPDKVRLILFVVSIIIALGTWVGTHMLTVKRAKDDLTIEKADSLTMITIRGRAEVLKIRDGFDNDDITYTEAKKTKSSIRFYQARDGELHQALLPFSCI